MEKNQLVRVIVNGNARKFTVAEVLYDGYDKDLHWRDATRWNELLIVRTAKGAIAMRSYHITQWQGERNSATWWIGDENAARMLLTSALAPVTPEFGLSRKLAEYALRQLGWWDMVAEEV